jgi:hypothetical protein
MNVYGIGSDQQVGLFRLQGFASDNADDCFLDVDSPILKLEWMGQLAIVGRLIQ